MAQLNDSVFPTEIDNDTLVEWVDGITECRADFLNTLRSAIINVEKVIGANNPATQGYGTSEVHYAMLDTYSGATRDSVAEHIAKVGGTTDIEILYNPHKTAAEDIGSATTSGYAGTPPESVQQHIDAVGNGVVDKQNPHGLDIRDIPTVISGLTHYMVTSGQSRYLKMISNTINFDENGEYTLTAVGAQTLAQLFPTRVLFAKGSVNVTGGIINEQIIGTHSVRFVGFVIDRFLPTSRMVSQPFSYIVVGY